MAEILEGFGGTPEQASRAVALLKSLSHEGRLQILCLLIENEMSVTQLAEALGTNPVNVSQQLMRLRAEGIVQTRREGKSVIYSLAREEVAAIVAALRDTFCMRH
ncbi:MULTISPECIES: ArsR/SmtB family transcription factor [Tabrizicola]|uniref:ArsR/SmtB family transcription factor n=1 Tax=Tabrizicola TaxID=1443919 RepID=UPI0010801E00|nr:MULTISPECIES: metalloregulator ArsR/SmtB family transcription factor [Paracoccaceae]